MVRYGVAAVVPDWSHYRMVKGDFGQLCGLLAL